MYLVHSSLMQMFIQLKEHLKLCPLSSHTGNYWIRVRAIGQCALDSNQIESFAVLTYYTGSEINDTELAFTTAMQPAYEDNFPPGIVCAHNLSLYLLFNVFNRTGGGLKRHNSDEIVFSAFQRKKL